MLRFELKVQVSSASPWYGSDVVLKKFIVSEVEAPNKLLAIEEAKEKYETIRMQHADDKGHQMEAVLTLKEEIWSATTTPKA